MKKTILSIVLILAMLFSLAACNSAEKLAEAKAKVLSDNGTVTSTADDYTLPGKVVVGETSFDITWTADVEAIKFTANADGTVAVDLPKVATDTAYVLTATIKDSKGNTETATFNRTIPTYVDTALANAIAFVKEQYKNKLNYYVDTKLIANSVYGGVTYPITWSVEVTSATGTVTVTKQADASWILDLPATVTEDISFKLTATISNEINQTKSETFEVTAPHYDVIAFDAYAASDDDTEVVVKGIVTGVISQSKDASNNCLYLEDSEGGYYVYGLTNDPVDDGIEVGMEVLVFGAKDTYNGTLEIVDATVVISNSTKAPVTPTDITSIYTNASALTDSELTDIQGSLVTLKGVRILGQETSSGYYKFKLGNLISYVRISSSVCPLTATEQDTFIDAHTDHYADLADVTGVVCLYNGAFYLTPVSANAFTNFVEQTLTAADKIEMEKGDLSTITTITENKQVSVALIGTTFDDVTISWASDNACAVVSGGKVTYTLPADATEVTTVTLTATFTSGATTDTKTFAVKVLPAQKHTIVAAPAVGTAYQGVAVQGTLGKSIYLTGEMNGNYFAVSDNRALAVDIYIEAVTGGFRIYFLEGTTKNYFDIYNYSATGVGVRITTEPMATYTWNATLGIYTATCLTDTYYLGTYGSNSRISSSRISYITAENKGISQYPLQICTITPLTDAEKVASEKAALTMKATVTANEEIALPAAGTTFTDVAITWASDNACAVVGGGNLTITLPATETVVKVTATLTIGEGATAVTDTVEFSITVAGTNASTAPKATYSFATSSTKTGTEITSAADALALFKASCASETYLESVAVTKVYDGTGSGGGSANTAGILKTGTGSAAGQIVLTFGSGKKITKVEVQVYGWTSGTNTVTVNGSTAQIAPVYVGTAAAPSLTFTLSEASNVITIDFANRTYVYSIVVYYEEEA